MSWITKLIAKCDKCGHEWIPVPSTGWIREHETGESFIPTHCAKCKSRLWNGSTRKEKTMFNEFAVHVSGNVCRIHRVSSSGNRAEVEYLSGRMEEIWIGSLRPATEEEKMSFMGGTTNK